MVMYQLLAPPPCFKGNVSGGRRGELMGWKFIEDTFSSSFEKSPMIFKRKTDSDNLLNSSS